MPAAEFEGPIDLGDPDRHQRADTLAVRAVAAGGRPPLAGEGPRDFVRAGAFRWFEGDVLIHVHLPTGRVTDLSREVGRLAGRDAPARLFQVDRHTDLQPILFNDCGLWAFDVLTAKLERAPLGLPDENVMTCPLPEALYGRRPDGALLVGVAPQQGGQVFVLDPATRAVKPTEGYCGLGPVDWYAARRDDWRSHDPQAAIHALYLARLAREAK